jgi:mono/diheme cytochrome c family protein
MKTGRLMSVTAVLFFLMPVISLPYNDQPYDLKASIERGREVYTSDCQSCHMENGEGLPDVFPPVAKTDYVKKDTKFLINIVLKGQEGEIVVNGKKYNTPMAAMPHLSDEQVADAYNYIRNSWGAKAPAILPSQVKAVR